MVATVTATGQHSKETSFGWTAVLLALVVAGVGCETAAAPPNERLPSRPELQPTGRDYKRVYLTQPGSTETDRHLGYVAKEFVNTTGEQKIVTTVIDLSFSPIGFYFEDGGATYVYVSDDEHKLLGNCEEQRSLELLFNQLGIYRFSEEL